MKRGFNEISQEEWSNHSFNPSRVIDGSGRRRDLPSIESFAYSGNNLTGSSPVKESSSDSVQVIEVLEDEESFENLEDDDVELDSREVRSSVRPGRRFVVEDEDDEEDDGLGGANRDGAAEAVELKSEGDESDFDLDGYKEDAVEESDVVGKALQKCAKISLELRNELYGSSVPACDRYAEVEASTVRIVTQDDVNEACGTGDTGFSPILKPYQLVGVNFLLLLCRKKIGGAILADEMGLGKTIQAITHLTLLNHLEDDPGPHLIVCPASLLENWERELKKWCPSFRVIQYHGAARSALAKELSFLGKANLQPAFNVMLVCYSLFERHSAQQKDDRKILKRFQWSCVLMDEAHALKDRNSYRWKNLMTVARNANQRLMLTGTPLQNDLHELWSLLEFMMPNLFETGDVDLKKLLNAEDRDLIARMKSILGPFILRRLKSDVMQQLVPKIQRVECVVMEKQQENAYKEAIEGYRVLSKDHLSKISNANSNHIINILPRRQISNYFVELRKIANHPLLVRRVYTDKDVVRFAKILHPKGVFGFECTLERVIKELKDYSDFSIHKLLCYYGAGYLEETLSDEYVMTSAKCQALSTLLPSLKQAGHRVLIFSQWTAMLDILEWTLDVIGVTYRRLDGR